MIRCLTSGWLARSCYKPKGNSGAWDSRNRLCHLVFPITLGFTNCRSVHLKVTEPWYWIMLLALSPVAGIIKSLPFEFTRNLSICSLVFVSAVLSSLIFFPIYFGVTKTVTRFEFLTRVSDKSRAKFNRYLGRWGYPGLAVLVGIPGPGTGAIVVSAIASTMRLNLWRSYFAVLVGCATQGGILAGICNGVIRL